MLLSADGQTPRLPVPREVRRIAERLEEAGFAAWCVGGAVRDVLLGAPHLDWDLATSATPEQVQRVFRRTVPVGIEHGTVGVLDRDGVLHEVTTFRRDVQTDGRHAVVEFGASLEEDLSRRDFTINAIAYSPTQDVIRDPFGGRADLAAGTLRAVGTPDQRMREDRLRALRALRFAGRFGLAIDPETWDAIRRSAPFLTRLSKERVKQEIEKTMEQLPHPSRSLLLWRASGALEVLLPAIHRQDDVSLMAPDWVGRPEATGREERRSLRQLTRLAVLFGGLAPTDARTVLHDLRFANRQVRAIGDVAEVLASLEPAARATLGGEWVSDGVIRRWVAAAGRTAAPLVLRTLMARWNAGRSLGHDLPPAGPLLSVYRRALRLAFRDPLAVSDLAIDGEDLMTLPVPAGPLVGRILRALLDQVLDDPSVNTRECLLARARTLAVGPEANRE